MKAESACIEQLGAYGPAQELIEFTNAAFAELKRLATSAFDARNKALADSNEITVLYEDADSTRPPTQFEAFVESFMIPTSDGTCRVQATRDTNFDTFDYFVYYLAGDCTD